tara:strand:- start:93 stop:311 length:219 start_codon:yes stop_codon:yes gene_type:complete
VVQGAWLEPRRWDMHQVAVADGALQVGLLFQEGPQALQALQYQDQRSPLQTTEQYTERPLLSNFNLERKANG